MPTLDWLDREQAMRPTLENSLAAAPTRELIHPGVLKYMREVGLLNQVSRPVRDRIHELVKYLRDLKK